MKLSKLIGRVLHPLQRFVRRIFCSHVYKTTKIVKLGKTKVISNAGVFIDIDCFDLYAHYQKCVKCGKKRIVQSGELITEA